LFYNILLQNFRHRYISHKHHFLVAPRATRCIVYSDKGEYMQKVFILQEDSEMREVLNNTYNELLSALKCRKPRAKSLIEDEELSGLHDLLALFRLGHIKISEYENMKGRFVMVQIKEGQKFF